MTDVRTVKETANGRDVLPAVQAGSNAISPAQLTVDTPKRRFFINVGSNLIYVALNSGLMVFYIPFLVRHLGLAAYGMIPLANSLVMYAAVVSASLDTSINRLLAIDLNQGNEAGAQHTFNTALALSLIGCAILAFPAAVVIYFFPQLFKVPAGMELATRFLFASTIFATLASIVSANFGIASLVLHRFDLRNTVRSLTSLSRVGVVWLCFMIWPASLWYVSAGFLLSACVGLVGDVLIWRRLTPNLHINWRDVDRQRLKALLTLSGWFTVSLIGYLLQRQVDLLIVNDAFGAEMTGRYGSLLLFPTLIYTMLEVVVSVLSPAIMARYAVGDTEGMQRIAIKSVKIIGVALALPTGLLCGFGAPLLTLWLGPDFAQLELLLTLLVGHLSINLAVRPLAYVLNAYNRAKVEGLVTLALGAANVLLAIALARYSGWGMLGVAAAGALTYTIRNTVFVSSYSAIVVGLRWHAFVAPLFACAVSTLGVALAAKYLSQVWWPSSWLALCEAFAIVSMAYGVVAYAVILSHSDRELLWSFIKRRSREQQA